MELLNKKEINKITVSEICKKADINRATFYRYYLDQYDLLDKIENEFLQDLKATFMPYNERFSIYAFTKEVYEKYKRRIGMKPFIKEVSFREAVDIDSPEDFDLAEVMLNVNL